VSVDLWEQVHSKVGGDGVELDRVAVQLAIELLHVLWLLLVLLLELQYLFELSVTLWAASDALLVYAELMISMATSKVNGRELEWLVTLRALFLLEVDSRCLHLHCLHLVLNYFIPDLCNFTFLLLDSPRLLPQFGVKELFQHLKL